MPQAQLGTVLRHVFKQLGAEPLRELTDGQLVQRFSKERDEAAFAALVQRHGRLVWSVCWQLLHHEHDAEDAFQAAFLVLARQAGSIRRGQSVASWLYRVAYRIAVKAAMDKANQRGHERKVEPALQREVHADLAWRELQAVLQEELQRLPDKYRAPFVLCCLEGKSKTEAAGELGWKEGTVSSRLMRARKLMQQRLARRGIELSAVLCAAALAEQATAALVSAALVESTVKAALVFGTSNVAPAGLVRAPAAVLAEGVLKTMFATRMKITTACVLALGLIATSVGTLAHHLAAEPPSPAPSAAQSTQLAPRPAKAEPPKAEPPKEPARPTEPTTEDKKEWIRTGNGDVLGDLFHDVTAGSGVAFTYRNGVEAGHLAILESIGGGVGLIDFDQDGLLDIFVTGGGYFDGKDKKEIKGHPCRLYKNLGNFKFKDVTKEVGLDGIDFYTHGCAVVDYDNDGWPDLLVTGYHGLALLHNEPDGRGGRLFVDVSRRAGLPQGLWTTSAAWADFDGDGFADLYVCQYVDWDLIKNHPSGTYDGKLPEVSPPKLFSGLQHKLFRNNRDGTFTDVTEEAGLKPGGRDASKGLGVLVVDVNGDGKPDIYVTNDTVDRLLYVNECQPGKFRFKEQGSQAGVARDDRGIPNGSTGVAAADFDGSGKLSLWCVNYEHELHALFRQVKGPPDALTFRFASQSAGLAAIGQKWSGWGTGFIDIDNDGWQDLVIINGPVHRPAGRKVPGQPPVLLRNKAGKFVDITRQGGEYFRGTHVGRGLAIGDLNNDGRPDLVISHLNEPVVILRNDADTGGHWIGLELRGKNGRDVVGALVAVDVGDRRLTRFVTGGGSYLSSSDRRLFLGLGKDERIKRITVIWPDGHEQKFPALEANRIHRLVEVKE